MLQTTNNSSFNLPSPQFQKSSNQPVNQVFIYNPAEMHKMILLQIANEPFNLQVVQEINMREDYYLTMFSIPKAIHPNYSRSVVYEITEPQAQLFRGIAQLPPVIRDLHHFHKILVMFLDKNPQFQGPTYIHIWFHIAHESFQQRKLVEIPEIPFEKKHMITAPFQLPFSMLPQAQPP